MLFAILLCPAPARATNAEIDNFDGRYLGARSWWESAGGVYIRNLANANPYRGTYSHQITYDKTAGGIFDYFGYDAGAGFDLSAYTHFGFYVYSVLNNTQILVDIWDDDGDEMRYGSQTVNQGAGWQQMAWQLNTGAFVATGDGVFEWTNVRRVLFFVWWGNNTATGIFRMDEMQVYTTALAAPAIDTPLSTASNNLPVTWNPVPGAALYEVWGEDNALFVAANANAGSGWVAAWPNTNSISLVFSSPGTKYTRVRAWTAAPGAGGACSLWSATESAVVSAVIPAYNKSGMALFSLLLGAAGFLVIRKKRARTC